MSQDDAPDLARVGIGLGSVLLYLVWRAIMYALVGHFERHGRVIAAWLAVCAWVLVPLAALGAIIWVAIQ